MGPASDSLRSLGVLLHRHRGLVLPAGTLALVLVLLTPLPPGLVDVLLAGGIALSALILLTSIRISRPLEFSVFPSVLLVVTLFRLVMNVATTRLILTSGAGGQDVYHAQLAAGRVVWAFGRFVTAGSLTVGVILFVILAVIQFVVITKGATRISEVAARFVLDALPGKQAAIDAELAAKLIDERQARDRRRQVTAEADFYGAMDGASKFLRGDAIAMALILGVNMVGGMYIGVVQYGWGWSQTADLFTRLTIGEGLAAQVPALLVSMSAAMLVSRSTARSDLGQEMVGQLTAHPAVLAVTAVFLGALMFTYLPRLPLALLGLGLGGLAYLLARRRTAPAPSSPADEAPPVQPAARHTQELPAVDPLRIELGYSLLRLVDAGQRGPLLERIAGLRRQIAGELGLLVPPVRIGDNLRLEGRRYRILVRGLKAAEGMAHPGMLLAVGPKAAALNGQAADDPVFGTPAVWISESERDRAEAMGYTIVDACGVIVTHLAEVVRRHAAELLSRRQTMQLLEALKARSPHLVEDVLGRFGAGKVQRVLCALLAERVSVQDLEAVLEAVSDFAGGADDLEALVEHVRAAMCRTLSQQCLGLDGRLRGVCLPAAMEEQIGTYVSQAGSAAVPPELGRQLVDCLGRELRRLQEQGRAPVVVCSPGIRPAVRRLVAGAMSEAVVLGYNEIDAAEVDLVEAPAN